ncbi:MAG: alpha/beta hydrolase [Terriglobia bacterium]
MNDQRIARLREALDAVAGAFLKGLGQLVQRFGQPGRRRGAGPGITVACLSLLMTLAVSAAAKDYETVAFSPAHLGGAQVSFNVILPHDYATTTRRFPVLYLLHGYTGHYSDWATKTGLVEYAKHYEEIIVMPEDENGWYVDNSANPKLGWQSYIIDDLIPYVDSHYRTVPSRKGRAIAGLSMGGYGAMLMGLKYHQLFAAAASLSGVLASAQPAFEEALPVNNPIHEVIKEDFGPLNNPQRRANDPFELIREIPVSELPDLYLAIGSSDELLQMNRDFVHILSEYRIPYHYCEVPGKHEWPVWDSQVQRVLALQAPIIGALPEGSR